MAKYKVTGKVTNSLGTVRAAKNIDAANETEAKAKVQEKWQISYGEILKDGKEIEEITVKAI